MSEFEIGDHVYAPDVADGMGIVGFLLERVPEDSQFDWLVRCHGKTGDIPVRTEELRKI